MYLKRPPPNPPVAELARPELKLAGLRLDEKQNSRSRMGHHTGIALGPLPKDETEINSFKDFTGIPEVAQCKLTLA